MGFLVSVLDFWFLCLLSTRRIRGECSDDRLALAACCSYHPIKMQLYQFHMPSFFEFSRPLIDASPIHSSSLPSFLRPIPPAYHAGDQINSIPRPVPERQPPNVDAMTMCLRNMISSRLVSHHAFILMLLSLSLFCTKNHWF